MCKCDFHAKEYLDAVIILHPLYPDSLMILLGDYVYVSENDAYRVVLGNVRHNNLVEIEGDSIFQVTNEDKDLEIPVLPIVHHLVDHPEDVVVIKADMAENELSWRPVKKSEKEKL